MRFKAIGDKEIDSPTTSWVAEATKQAKRTTINMLQAYFSNVVRWEHYPGFTAALSSIRKNLPQQWLYQRPFVCENP